MRWLSMARDLGVRLRLPMTLGMVLRPLGHVCFARGERAEGLAMVREAVERLETTEHPRLIAIACCELAWMLFEEGDLDGATRYAERALANADGAPVARQFSLALRARIACREGRADEAVRFAEEAAALRVGDRAIFDSDAMADLARIEARMAQGDTAGAREAAAAAWAHLCRDARGFGLAEHRRAYLMRVPLHREIHERCEALGVAAPVDDAMDAVA